MTVPNYSFVLSAQLVGSTTMSVGNVMITSPTDGTKYVLATTANRGTRRAEGIALTAYGGTSTGSVQMQQAGTIDATTSGLAAGSASWVRCSTTGAIERCTPSGSDDIIGYAEADGRVHLAFGTWTAAIINAGGASSFTAGGDLSGTNTVQSVDKIKGTAVTTAGGALATGAVMRATGVSTADWGAVNLASANAVTGLLPVANIAPSGTNTWVLTTTGGVAVWAAASGSGFTAGGDLSGTSSVQSVDKVHGATIPAAGALTTGNAPYVSGVSALTYSALNLAGGAGWVSGLLPLANQAAPTGTGLAKVSAGAWVGAAALLVNADVNAAAAIAVSKLAVGTGSQYIGITGGVPTWQNVAASEIAGIPGSSGNYLYNNAGVIGAKTIVASDIGSLPGSSGNPLYNNAGAIGAATNWSIGTGLTGSTSSFVTVASYVQSPILRASSSFVAVDGSTSALFLGSDSSYANGYTDLRLNTNTTSGNIYLMLGSQGCITVSSSSTTLRARAVSGAITLTTTANFSLPVGGDSAVPVPFQWQVASLTMTAGAGTATNLSNAQLVCPILEVTTTADGQQLIFVAAAQVSGAPWWVRVVAGGNASILLRKTSGSGGVTFTSPTGKTQPVYYSPTATDIVTLGAPG